MWPTAPTRAFIFICSSSDLQLVIFYFTRLTILPSKELRSNSDFMCNLRCNSACGLKQTSPDYSGWCAKNIAADWFRLCCWLGVAWGSVWGSAQPATSLLADCCCRCLQTAAAAVVLGTICFSNLDEFPGKHWTMLRIFRKYVSISNTKWLPP